jgi:hypothetical protein
MKKLLLGSLLLISTMIYAQESQKDTVIKNQEDKLQAYLNNVDKFTGEKIYYSASNKVVSFAKFVNKQESSQYVSIDVIGSTLNYGCTGVNILFDNGKMINRPNEDVKTDYRSGNWVYTAFFRPTANEVNLFKSSKVEAVKLYIYDTNVNSIDADNLQLAANIMLSTPKITKTPVKNTIKK